MPFEYYIFSNTLMFKNLHHLIISFFKSHSSFSCYILEEDMIVNPCNPSPCGPNSECRVNNNQAVCSCKSSYLGSPPNCRPECVVSTECSLTRACVNQKCVDPCLNSCGVNANCRIINHSPICFCNNGYTGDPFTACFRVPGTE